MSNLVFTFEAFLTFIAPDIFTTRMKLFLKPGHSHNASDVITGECGRLLLHKNLYTVEQMAKAMNRSKNINVSVLQNNQFRTAQDSPVTRV